MFTRLCGSKMRFGLMIGLLVLPAAAFAADTPASRQTQNPAGEFIQDLGNKAIAVIADQSLSQDQRQAKYRQLLHDAFDLKTIGHFVIGRAWNTATPEQRDEYMKLFEDLVVKIYGDRLNFYSGESFHVKGARPESDRDTIVNSEIDHPGGGQPTSIDWRVRNENGQYKVIDVVIEGVSQSVTQRQEYASIIQRDGGKIDGLLTLMRQRLQQPDAGTAQPNATQ